MIFYMAVVIPSFLLALVSPSLAALDSMQWVKLGEVKESSLIPNAWEGPASGDKMYLSYLIRLTTEDTSHIPSTWIPGYTDKVFFAWNNDVRFVKTSENQFKIEALQYSKPSLSWEFVFKDNVPIDRMLSVGSMADGRLVYACRAFHKDGIKRVVIGRYIRGPEGKVGNGGCRIHVHNGPATDAPYFEVATINYFGLTDDGKRSVDTTEDYCLRNLCQGL